MAKPNTETRSTTLDHNPLLLQRVVNRHISIGNDYVRGLVFDWLSANSRVHLEQRGNFCAVILVNRDNALMGIGMSKRAPGDSHSDLIGHRLSLTRAYDDAVSRYLLGKKF